MDNDNAARIRYLRNQLQEKENELEIYRGDYKILVDQENEIVQLMVVCENTDYLTKCLSSSTKNMQEIINTDTVPGFEDLANFDNVDDYNSQIVIANNDYSTNLKDTCTIIDQKKQEVAEKIANLKTEISNIETQLSILGG
ncbi:MAG: hypothetical protein IKE70_01370 [Bacilli bacterium]|nr:hypothetical protein [Bacilli bacterium]